MLNHCVYETRNLVLIINKGIDEKTRTRIFPEKRLLTQVQEVKMNLLVVMFSF